MSDLGLFACALLVNIVALVVAAVPVSLVVRIVDEVPDAVSAVALLASGAWMLGVFYYANMHVLRRLVGD